MSLHWPVFYTTVCCCLGCLGFGLQIGYSSPVIPQLTQHGELLHKDPHTASLFASMAALGMAVGCAVAGYLTEALGRRWTALANCAPFLTGWLLLMFAQSSTHLIWGRFLTGIASAIASVLSPLYVAEVSPKVWRGVLVTFTCFCITFGVFCGYCMGVFLTWRQQAAVGVLLAGASMFFIPFAPESPRYLVKINDISNARKTLMLLQNDNGVIVEKELREIEESLSEQDMGIKEVLCSPHLRGPLLVAVGLMAFCSMTGIGVIMLFMSSIFQSAGYSDTASVRAPVIIVALQLVSIVISGSVIDRVGRIPLLLTSSIGMTLSYLIMGFFFYLGDLARWSWVFFLCLVGYKVTFGLGWGIVCSLMATEVTPTKARGPATALSHMIAGVVSFILAALYHPMQATVGSEGVVWTYALFCALGGAFVLKCVPETKGRTLEEIETYFHSTSNP